MSLRLNSSGGGSVTLQEPVTANNQTLMLPDASGTIAVDSPPAGTIIFYAASTAPAGYLKANGAAVSRTAYAALFSAIGTTFGVGDGSTTFTLPDMRGEFPRGWDDGRGVDSGRAFGSAQTDEFESHTHNMLGGGAGFVNGSIYALTTDAGAVPGVRVIAATTSTGASETRPRNIALLACIKF